MGRVGCMLLCILLPLWTQHVHAKVAAGDLGSVFRSGAPDVLKHEPKVSSSVKKRQDDTPSAKPSTDTLVDGTPSAKPSTDTLVDGTPSAESSTDSLVDGTPSAEPSTDSLVDGTPSAELSTNAFVNSFGVVPERFVSVETSEKTLPGASFPLDIRFLGLFSQPSTARGLEPKAEKEVLSLPNPSITVMTRRKSIRSLSEITEAIGTRSTAPLVTYEAAARAFAEDHDAHENHDSIWWHKLGATCVIIFVTVLGCVMPYYFDRTKKCTSLMPYVNSFAAGAFLGLALFHLLPEALHSPHESLSRYNVIYVVICSGFLFIFMVEKVVAPAITKQRPEFQILSHHQHHCHVVSDRQLHGRKTTEAASEVTENCHSPCCKKKIESAPSPPTAVSSSALPLTPLERDETSALSGVTTPHRSLSFPSETRISSCNRHSITRKSLSHCHLPQVYNSVTQRVPSLSQHPISFVAFFMCLSLCIHSVFEGIVVGLFTDPSSVWVGTLTIAGHKWAAAFALAANFIHSRVATKVTTVYLSIFALATPVGILIGLEASKADAKLFTIMTALSLGTILYAACEMLFNEFEHFNRLKQEFLKVLCVFLGAGLVFGLTILHLQGGTHVHTS